MKRCLMTIFCVLAACAVSAESLDAIRKQAEASMLVTGSVEITPEGSVKDYSIDHPDKLPQPVVQLIRQSMPSWRFRFSSPQTAAVTAKMSLRLVAKHVDNNHDSLSISGAEFQQGQEIAGESTSLNTVVLPRYPELERVSNASGTVYVMVQIGRDGHVIKAVAQQVNLHVYASDGDMRIFRADFARAAISAIQKWTFNIPTIGKQATYSCWYARVPINFAHSRAVAYGRWQAYIPGPLLPLPWSETKKLPTNAVDAIPDGELVQTEQNLWLTTPLSGA